MRKTFSKYLILFFILTLSISNPPHVEASLLIRKFYKGPWSTAGPWSWEEARQECRSAGAVYHSDLAIMRNLMETNKIIEICSDPDCGHDLTSCWIGFRRDENFPHYWKMVNNVAYHSTIWPLGEPSTEDKCARLNCSKLHGEDCTLRYFRFACQMDNLILVKEDKTWEEALDHCRALKVDISTWLDNNNNEVHFAWSDLLSLHSKEEFAYANSILREAQIDEVWIGLRWLAGRWLWMDGGKGNHNSLPVCPANGMNCGTLSEKGNQARNCVGRRNFFCFQIV